MLSPDRFPEYFMAVHGKTPFPWQRRLLDEVVKENAWPEALSLPTGAGKTSILDVAVFALACGARIPRRTVLVVDRRIVVDDAFNRAVTIRRAIMGESEKAGHTNPASLDVLHEVRVALESLGGESALDVALLRGGIYREDTWVRHPATPMLICSTVDQTGSRLLHRGYGVSPNMRSVHAGILGNDTLIVLDEAHASEAFRQTLSWIERYHSCAHKPLPLPFAVLTMTATPRAGQRTFTLDHSDQEDPVLSRRLRAKKTISLAAASAPKSDGLVKEILKHVKTLAEKPGKTVLVVVNRVATARSIAEELSKLKKNEARPLAIEEPVLLTGRSRPLERDRLLDSVRGRVFAGRNRTESSTMPSLVVVATQCVEVGADLDADALVTQACPLDALRQRMGRLDRLGELGASSAVVVAEKELVDCKPGTPYDDPVYGDAAHATWIWLSDKVKTCTLDGGIESFDALLVSIDESDKSRMLCPAADAPIMLPGHLDAWVQTSPEPHVEPEPALFLHGPARADADVQILWRADLDPGKPETWAEAIELMPPLAGEALPVPIFRCKAWLSGMDANASGGGDLEGELSEDAAGSPRGKKDEQKPKRRFLVWRGESTTDPGDDPSILRVGDTIILPASAGGCDAWGWAPGSADSVLDLASLARYRAGATPVLRLHPDMKGELPECLYPLLEAPKAEDGDDPAPAALALLRSNLSQACQEASVPSILAALTALKESKKLKILRHPSGSGWVATGERAMKVHGADTFLPGDPGSEDDSSSRRRIAVLLEDHTRHVVQKAESMAVASRMDTTIVESLTVSARFHDTGKGDPRFQLLLNGGDRFAVFRQGLLAKSPDYKGRKARTPSTDPRFIYPPGARHELLSLRFAERLPEEAFSGMDRELILHLIASHHGRCRPFAPAFEDPAPRSITCTYEGTELSATTDCIVDGIAPAHVASGVAQRFWNLVRRYGWWGLSYLEACLRLADHRASAEEERSTL